MSMIQNTSHTKLSKKIKCKGFMHHATEVNKATGCQASPASPVTLL